MIIDGPPDDDLDALRETLTNAVVESLKVEPDKVASQVVETEYLDAVKTNFHLRPERAPH